MEAPVPQSWRATGLGRNRDRRGIGGDPCDTGTTEKIRCRILEPAGVPWFAREMNRCSRREVLEEPGRELSIVFELWGQLYEKHRQFGFERADLLQELVNNLVAVGKLALVRHRFRRLYRKAKVSRHAVGPTGPSRRAMRPVKAGVDLDGAKVRGVALQCAAFRFERAGVDARYAPACRPDEDRHGRRRREERRGLGRAGCGSGRSGVQPDGEEHWRGRVLAPDATRQGCWRLSGAITISLILRHVCSALGRPRCLDSIGRVSTHA